MRLTTRTNLALRTLMVCAVNDGRIVRKHEIAEACNASENHLAQVINALAQAGFVDTTRGRKGGLRLAHPADRVSIGAVVRAFESEVPFAECFDLAANTCPLVGGCRMRLALDAALAAFYGALDGWTLADLVEDNAALERLLTMSSMRSGHALACH